VRAAYDDLSMLRGDSPKNGRRARREGWAPPLAWDEEAIDAPQGVPRFDAAEPDPAGGNAADRWLLGESVVLGPRARREVIAHLMEWTDQSPEQIGAQLDMTADAVSRSWERIKARAREAGQPVPVRRLLVVSA
jgi:hypothetical protein